MAFILILSLVENAAPFPLHRLHLDSTLLYTLSSLLVPLGFIEDAAIIILKAISRFCRGLSITNKISEVHKARQALRVSAAVWQYWANNFIFINICACGPLAHDQLSL